MKRVTSTVFALVIAAIGLAGCATPQVITLKDGTRIETRDEAEYQDETGFYEFETAGGLKKAINKDEVFTIENR